MKTPLLAFMLVAAPLAIGCAVTEVEAGEPALPQNVGYTPPSDVPMPPPPAPPLAQGAEGNPPESPPPGSQDPSQDVVIGGADGDAPAAPAPPQSDGYADTDPSALTDFRSTLDPYGTWTEDPTYGTVWVPSQAVVGEDFAPYVSAGHWGYDSDYVWVSDYDWGWAPFHYGRWVYGRSAWEWIPGRAYAGAWASWRYGEFGYVGWAPLPPTWGWRGGCAVGLGFVPSAPYTFVGTEHLFSPSLGGHVVAGGQVGVIAAHTQPWVPASAGAGHSAAHPVVGGPPPSALHIQAAAITRVHPSDSGLAQARAFSRASTATTLGARAPQTAASWSRGAAASGMARGPTYAAEPSHFGGRLGAGFSGSVGSAATTMRSPYTGGARPAYGASPAYGGRFSSGTPARSFGGYGAYGGAHASPFVGAYRGGGSPQGFHGGGGFTGGGGAFHSSGGGGFHGGGGGGGGFHGGGGGGGHGGGHR